MAVALRIAMFVAWACVCVYVVVCADRSQGVRFWWFLSVRNGTVRQEPCLEEILMFVFRNRMKNLRCRLLDSAADWGRQTVQ